MVTKIKVNELKINLFTLHSIDTILFFITSPSRFISLNFQTDSDEIYILKQLHEQVECAFANKHFILMVFLSCILSIDSFTKKEKSHLNPPLGK